MRFVKFKYILFFSLVAAIIFSCQKLEFERELRIENDSIFGIEVKNAVAIASIKDIGNGVTHYGHCWSINQKPTILDEHTDFGATLAPTKVESYLENLEPSTQYFIRPYASDGERFLYGEEITFITKPAEHASLSSNIIRDITMSSARVISELKSIGIGNDSVFDYGHCWQTTSEPTIHDSITSFGIARDTTTISSQLKLLTSGTTYYVRSYAINATGVSYGEQSTFSTIAPTLASVNTGSAHDITTSTAVVNGEITDLGISTDTIIQHGHCWSTRETPTKHDSCTSLGQISKTGSFTSNINGLKEGITYYIRAYATNKVGTSYGEQVTLEMKGELPVISLLEIVSNDAHSLGYKAEVTSSGSGAVIERGICLSTTPTPTKEEHAFINGNDTGLFVGELINLDRATIYYARAYAQNAFGISYSNQIQIKTLPELPIIQTKEVTNITTNSALSGGIIIDDGGEELIEKGICWSTEPEPTINGYSSIGILEGSGFIATATDLDVFSNYYIRSYAKNRGGTSYGNTILITTDYLHDTITITDTRDGQTYKTVKIGNQWWMAENLNYYYAGSVYYNLDSNSNAKVYGRQYTIRYNIVNDLCPTGWHIPSFLEWQVLVATLGGMDNAGGKLKQSGTINWSAPNSEALNSSGFNATPGGWSDGIASEWGYPETPIEETSFKGIHEQAKFLQLPTEQSDLRSWNLNYNDGKIVHKKETFWESTLSIRCIKD